MTPSSTISRVLSRSSLLPGAVLSVGFVDASCSAVVEDAGDGEGARDGAGVVVCVAVVACVSSGGDLVGVNVGVASVEGVAKGVDVGTSEGVGFIIEVTKGVAEAADVGVASVVGLGKGIDVGTGVFDGSACTAMAVVRLLLKRTSPTVE